VHPHAAHATAATPRTLLCSRRSHQSSPDQPARGHARRPPPQPQPPLHCIAPSRSHGHPHEPTATHTTPPLRRTIASHHCVAAIASHQCVVPVRRTAVQRGTPRSSASQKAANNYTHTAWPPPARHCIIPPLRHGVTAFYCIDQSFPCSGRTPLRCSGRRPTTPSWQSAGTEPSRTRTHARTYVPLHLHARAARRPPTRPPPAASSQWEDAAELFEKAANNFKLAKCWNEAAEMYDQYAQCQLKLESQHEAATACVGGGAQQGFREGTLRRQKSATG
jgi:hypothetical protein